MLGVGILIAVLLLANSARTNAQDDELSFDLPSGNVTVGPDGVSAEVDGNTYDVSGDGVTANVDGDSYDVTNDGVTADVNGTTITVDANGIQVQAENGGIQVTEDGIVTTGDVTISRTESVDRFTQSVQIGGTTFTQTFETVNVELTDEEAEQVRALVVGLLADFETPLSNDDVIEALRQLLPEWLNNLL
jgi:hypothetical protein